MSDFIQGDDFNRAGGEAERIVWDAIKSVLNKRDLLAYSRYPLFQETGEKRKEPDILILDKELGIIIIEVKSFSIGDIESIEPNRWTVKNSYTRTLNPLSQAEDYLYSVKGKFDTNRELRNKTLGKAFIALPNITFNEFSQKGYLTALSKDIFIFKDDLNAKVLINKLMNSPSLFNGNSFNDEGYRIAKAILGHENNHVEDIDDYLPEGTKADVYNKVKTKLYSLDMQQERIAKSEVPGPQRIRGIAGSGKTMLICQKAAYMHLKHPEWKIAVTFFTQSLYEIIIRTIDMYIRAFTNGELKYDENSNLKVLHAWGRRDKNGLYREIAARNNCTFLNVGDVKRRTSKAIGPQDSINYVACELLKEAKGNLDEIYDAIFIDEGQDLVGDNKYKFEGKQALYYMTYKSIKRIENNDGKDIRRLVWAYDELQSLSEAKIPSGREIFGDPTLVTGIYKGGVKKSEIMKKCYRTPHQILTSAHAIGMGFFREEGMVTGYTTQKDWESIGYKVSGDFRKDGNEIFLERPLENSPNPISGYYKGSTIEFVKYSTESDLINDLAEYIYLDIVNQKLNPSKDILIVNLRDHYDGIEYVEMVGRAIRDKGIDYYVPRCSRKNIACESDWRNNKPDKFWEDGAITISPINRAKGNEAAMVYVIGVENVAENEGSVSHRNKLFTAITRAKSWVKVMAAGSYPLYSEIEKAIDSNGKFKIIYKKPKREPNNDEIE